MSLTFAELIIYLLPGFLGLWVFKRVVQESIDKRGESTQLALALLLGVSAFLLLFISNGILSLLAELDKKIPPEALVLSNMEDGNEFSHVWYLLHGFLLLCNDLAQFCSPTALSSLAPDGARVILWAKPTFWTSYGALCYFALKSGEWLALIRERGWSPTWHYSECAAKKLNRGAHEPCESSLRGMVDMLKRERQGPSYVRIYMLGSGRDRALIGRWAGYSESEKEIELTALEMCDSDHELNKTLSKYRRCCWINHNSGVVVEFLQCGEKHQKEIEQRLAKSYITWLNTEDDNS